MRGASSDAKGGVFGDERKSVERKRDGWWLNRH